MISPELYFKISELKQRITEFIDALVADDSLIEAIVWQTSKDSDVTAPLLFLFDILKTLAKMPVVGMSSQHLCELKRVEKKNDN